MIFGLGNFVSNQSPAADLAASTEDGIIATATVTRGPTGRWAVSKMQDTPTWVDIGPYTVTPVVAGLKNPKPRRRTGGAAIFPRTVSRGFLDSGPCQGRDAGRDAVALRLCGRMVA